jgi:hypothetical protein
VVWGSSSTTGFSVVWGSSSTSAASVVWGALISDGSFLAAVGEN